MKTIGWIVGSIMVIGIAVEAGQVFAQRDEMLPGYPQSLVRSLERLLERMREDKPSPDVLIRVSSTYFDLADDLLTDETKRREVYEAGAKAAEQAFQLDDSNPDAHFFHAANLGSAERLRGIANAAMVVKEIKHCAMRAIEINPKHSK